jgi:hypothetical protein
MIHIYMRKALEHAQSYLNSLQKLPEKWLGNVVGNTELYTDYRIPVC